MLFHPPSLDADDHRVVHEIDEFRRELRHWLGRRRRWRGQLRRNLKARAIRGSNSIEGYDVSLDDAVALLEDDEPLTADHRTSLEITGYRNAMTYIQQIAEDPYFRLDESFLRSLHFMMLGHDLNKSPGQYRTNTIYVHDDEHGEIAYEGPDSDSLPELMSELVESLQADSPCPIYVRAAIAHLNLVMIHPFRDGNGRMARALQTLILAREKILAPEFSSIEEWLGRNTSAYYDVLASTGKGEWNPGADTTEWTKFNLRAHHIQAQTVLRRIEESSRMWQAIDDIIEERKLPERAGYALYDAIIGLHVRRAGYERQASLEPGTAARDLRQLVSSDYLVPVGETKARTYIASGKLRAIRDQVASQRTKPTDPYRVGRVAG